VYYDKDLDQEVLIETPQQPAEDENTEPDVETLLFEQPPEVEDHHINVVRVETESLDLLHVIDESVEERDVIPYMVHTDGRCLRRPITSNTYQVFTNEFDIGPDECVETTVSREVHRFNNNQGMENEHEEQVIALPGVVVLEQECTADVVAEQECEVEDLLNTVAVVRRVFRRAVIVSSMQKIERVPEEDEEKLILNPDIEEVKSSVIEELECVPESSVDQECTLDVSNVITVAIRDVDVDEDVNGSTERTETMITKREVHRNVHHVHKDEEVIPETVEYQKNSLCEVQEDILSPTTIVGEENAPEPMVEESTFRNRMGVVRGFVRRSMTVIMQKTSTMEWTTSRDEKVETSEDESDESDEEDEQVFVRRQVHRYSTRRHDEVSENSIAAPIYVVDQECIPTDEVTTDGYDVTTDGYVAVVRRYNIVVTTIGLEPEGGMEDDFNDQEIADGIRAVIEKNLPLRTKKVEVKRDVQRLTNGTGGLHIEEGGEVMTEIFQGRGDDVDQNGVVILQEEMQRNCTVDDELLSMHKNTGLQDDDVIYINI